MRVTSLVLMRRPTTLLAAMLLLPFIEFCDSSISSAFAGKSGSLVNASATHFVATNGSDDGPGTADRPWATINHAAEQVEAGGTVVVRGGHYILAAQVRPRNSGRFDAWITFIGYPGETPILDAQMVPRASLVQDGLYNGAFQIEGISYVGVANLTVINWHAAGFTIRDSSNIDLINNSI